MLKSYKASDQQWIEWIQKTKIEDEKRWAYIFFGLAIISPAVAVIGVFLGRIEFLPGILAGMFFGIMGFAKINNFRLYRIIQSLADNPK